MQCPKCRNEVVPSRVGFTWWGGMVGSHLINHVQCPMCGARFNGKTGQDNTSAIAIYLVVAGVLSLALVFFLIRGMR